MACSSDLDSKKYFWAHDFPEELWLSEIAPELGPMDVLSLSQTCRRLRSTLSRISIWRSILVSVCDTYGLFLPSYPLAEMGLEELQLASLRPHRVQSLIQRKMVPVQELHNAVPLLAKESSEALPSDWTTMCLVPGGKFLIMIRGGTSGGRLEMWDLGLPGRRPLPEPTLLANTEVYAQSTFYGLFACPHGDSLRVAVCYTLQDQTRLFRVFSISPSDSKPEFDQLASVRLSMSAHLQVRQSFAASRALFLEADWSCILCDFEKSRFVRWAFEVEDTQRGVPWRTYLTQGHVFLLSHTEALVWKIASLESRSQRMPVEINTNAIPLATIPPDLTIVFAGQTTEANNERLMSQFTPFLGSRPSLTFDIFEKRLSCLRFCRYVLSDSSDVPQAELISTGDFPGDWFYKALFLSGDVTHIEVEHEGVPRLVVYNGAGSSESMNSSDAPSALLTALERATMLWASCIASGRFIYKDFDTSDPPTCIVDYL